MRELCLILYILLLGRTTDFSHGEPELKFLYPLSLKKEKKKEKKNDV